MHVQKTPHSMAEGPTWPRYTALSRTCCCRAVAEPAGNLGEAPFSLQKLAAAAPAPPQDAGQGFEVNVRTIIAVVIAFLVASLAASAGVGGGAFFVPLYMLALGFGEHSVNAQASNGSTWTVLVNAQGSANPLPALARLSSTRA